MKAKKILKKIKKFKEKNGCCYIYIEGSNSFYSNAFVIPILESGEEVVIHNGRGDKNGFKIYETISNKKYRKRLTLMFNEVPIIARLNNSTKNYVHSHRSDFDESNGEQWNIKKRK